MKNFSRILKTGTRIGDPALGGADELSRCFAFDAIAAWRALDRGRLVW